MSLEISWVRPPMRPLTDSRSDRVFVADFSINAVRRLGIDEGGAMRIEIPAERLQIFPQEA